MAVLAVAMMSAEAWKILLQRRVSPAIMILFFLVLALEYCPQPIPLTRIAIPGAITQLRQESEGGGVLDLASEGPVAMYFQTIYEKPLAYGYTSRIHQSVAAQQDRMTADLRQIFAQQNYAALRTRYQLEYVLAPGSAAPLPKNAAMTVLYHDADMTLYKVRG